MTTISFNSIAQSLRLPFVGVEFDSSHAQQGPSILTYQAVMIGQKLTAGTWTADTIQRATSVDDALVGGGRGSMIHREAIAWFASNKSTALYFAVVADNGAGVAATGTIVFTAAATGSGTLAFYFGGVRVEVAVTAGDTTTTLATNTKDAINAALDLPITATSSTATVTMLFRHKGLTGNTYDVRLNYRDDDVTPAGVTMTINAMGGVIAGTTAPSLTNVIAAMSDLWFNIWAHPYTDATSLSAIEAELASRFGPMRSIDGVAFTSASGSFSTLTTLGNTRNSPHSEIVAQPGASPLTPPMEFAAETAALIALHGAADPGRPFTTIAMTNALPPAETDQWSNEERNLLLFEGIATTRRAAGGVVQLERMITTYQTSAAGAADTAYLDVNTLLTLMYLRSSFRDRIQLKYSRHKLKDDGGPRAASGQFIMTPKLGEAEALGWFREMEELGLVEGYEQFARDVVVVRDPANPNRLNFLLPCDLINQLLITAAQMQFLL